VRNAAVDCLFTRFTISTTLIAQTCHFVNCMLALSTDASGAGNKATSVHEKVGIKRMAAVYLNQSVTDVAISLALLYLTILQFGNVMIAW
jgi:hypothetical protein